MSSKTCTECDRPRAPGRRRCPECINLERRDRYANDHTYRAQEKARHNEWRASHLPQRADAQRQLRARRKETSEGERNPHD